MNTLYQSVYLKKFRKDKAGKAPIVIRVTIDSKRVDIPTGAKLEPEKWDVERQKVIGHTDEVKRVSARINSYQNKILSAYTRLMSEVHQPLMRSKTSFSVKETRRRALGYYTCLKSTISALKGWLIKVTKVKVRTINTAKS